MPIRPVQYTPQPYVRETRTLGQLLGLQAATSGQMWSDLGATLAGGLRQYAQERQQAPIRAQEAEIRRLQLEGAQAESTARQRTSAQEQALTAFMSSPDFASIPDDEKLRRLTSIAGPQKGPKLFQDWFASQQAPVNAATAAADRARKIETEDRDYRRNLNKDGVAEMNTLADNARADAAALKPKTFSVTVDDGRGRPVEKLVTEDDLRQGVPVYRAPSAPKGDEPLVAVMGDDGTPVLMPRSQAVGRRPASTREQGRAVTSGDAGRIAELDTSLDDLAVLRKTLFPDADLATDVETNQPTGTYAAIQAGIPNWATELLGGWGAGAKQRQATIDRVKQVIGKALEGGVLRKEDEYKYTKILPTIQDVPAVVKAKLDGLDQAIALRRDRELDAREDAGYDVSRFRARGAQPATSAPKSAPTLGQVVTVRGQKVRVTKINPDGTYEGVPVQ